MVREVVETYDNEKQRSICLCRITMMLSSLVV